MIFNHICLDRYWLVSLILLLVRWCFLSDYVWNWIKTNTFPGRISPSSFSILDNESKITGVLLSEICGILGWLSVFPADFRGAVAGEDCVGSARFRRRCRCCQRGEAWRKFPDCCSNPVAFRGGVACDTRGTQRVPLHENHRKPIRRRLFKQFDSRKLSFQKSVELCWIMLNSIPLSSLAGKVI